MLRFMYDALYFSRRAFTRNITWIYFCMAVIGFIGASEMVGVTSLCRFWGGGESLYNAFLHFFRVSNWSLSALVVHWTSFVVAQNMTVKLQGRAVLLGDHTLVPKDGRKMPGVVSLRQESETQSKPSYFRGHCWGAVGMLIGSMATPFCLPMVLGIHSGTIHIVKTEKKNLQTMGARIVQMAIDTATRHGLPSVLVMDAYFPSKTVFKLSESVQSIALRQPLVTLIIRAKKTVLHSLRQKNRSIKALDVFPNMVKKSN